MAPMDREACMHRAPRGGQTTRRWRCSGFASEISVRISYSKCKLDERLASHTLVEQLVEVLKILDNSLPDVEQVIEVPKIFSDVIPSRSSVSEPQLAEQLVEVPTLVSLSLPVDPKEEDTIVAVVCDAMGRTWFQVSGPRGRWWWLSGTQHTQSNHPSGYTAGPGRDTNTGRCDDG